MNYNTIHETVIKDIMDIISDGIDAKDSISGKATSISKSSSLSKATSGLTLVFPVLGSKNNSYETNAMIVKAVERQCVSLLQIAFSAFNITNTQDATQYIKQFHTNLGSGKMTLDAFIDIMDEYVQENGLLPKENAGMYKAVLEDLKNLSYYFGEDISESSLNNYRVKSTGMNRVIVQEAPEVSNPALRNNNMRDYQNDRFNRDTWKHDYDYRASKDDRDFNYRISKDTRDRNDKLAKDAQDRQDKLDSQSQQQTNWQSDFDQRAGKNAQDQQNWERDRAAKDRRDDRQNAKDTSDMLRNQIIPSDVKKINEMVPTMVIVNFTTMDKEVPITQQVVIGVKAKLYPVDSMDVVNKLATKHVDGNIMLKLVKASTREISFVKDLIFAIDNAKLAAIANSKHGSKTNRLLKVLERRALGGKIRKTFKMNNAYKAISTLVISREEADYVMQQHNIDLTSVKVIRPIMEKLNLMMFIIADETTESIEMIMDSGDDVYETLTFSQLEREASDSSSKKAINLMTKLAR